MADVLLPPIARFASSKFHYIDSTGMTRGIYSGAIETTAYGGDRFGASLVTITEGGQSTVQRKRRARLQTWLMSLKGKQNRIWLGDQSYQRRGSFPSAEVLVNGGFSDASAWTGASGASIAAVDNVLRVTLGGATTNPQATSAATVTANVPYAVRAFLRRGRGGIVPTLQASDGVVGVQVAAPATDGFATLAIVPTTTPLNITAFLSASNAIVAGDFFEVQYASIARCALVDGGPNLLLRSDTPGGTSWSLTNATSGANGTAGPDGFNDAFYLAETATTAAHYTTQAVTVPAAAADYAFSVHVKSANRSWCFLQLQENGSGTGAACFFNSTTGAVGTVGTATGANWANLRTFSENCGNGWFRFTIVARKTNAATGVVAFLGAATADGTSSYLGVSPVPFVSWRASLSASSSPTRATQTVASTAAPSTVTAGFTYLKGLPASTAGLLLPGDQLQIGNQLVMVTASLDSNEAGLGYLQFSPPLRIAPADNTPVIVTQPMGRFVFVGQSPEWDNMPGFFSSASLDLEEACDV